MDDQHIYIETAISVVSNHDETGQPKKNSSLTSVWKTNEPLVIVLLLLLLLLLLLVHKKKTHQYEK